VKVEVRTAWEVGGGGGTGGIGSIGRDKESRGEVRTGVVALRVVWREGREGAVAVPETPRMIT